jgi:hypothetical protein
LLARSEACVFGFAGWSRLLHTESALGERSKHTVQNGQSWLNLYLDGAISEIATRRSEFAAVQKRDGIDGLIAALDRKVELLTATEAKSF